MLCFFIRTTSCTWCWTALPGNCSGLPSTVGGVLSSAWLCLLWTAAAWCWSTDWCSRSWWGTIGMIWVQHYFSFIIQLHWWGHYLFSFTILAISSCCSDLINSAGHILFAVWCFAVNCWTYPLPSHLLWLVCIVPTPTPPFPLFSSSDQMYL